MESEVTGREEGSFFFLCGVHLKTISSVSGNGFYCVDCGCTPGRMIFVNGSLKYAQTVPEPLHEVEGFDPEVEGWRAFFEVGGFEGMSDETIRALIRSFSSENG